MVGIVLDLIRVLSVSLQHESLSMYLHLVAKQTTPAGAESACAVCLLETYLHHNQLSIPKHSPLTANEVS